MLGIIRKVFSFILAFIAAIAGLFMPAKKELSPEKLLEEMTLEQKVCQMLMPAFRTWNGADVTVLPAAVESTIEKYDFGGIIVFSENCRGTEQTARLVYNMQSAAGRSEQGVPMLIGIDQEGGSIVRLKTGTYTCGNMALGAINSSEETKKSASIIGSELYSLGINTDFAPDMDVNSNPANPVIGLRSFSSSPVITARMGRTFIEGMHSENVATAIKHFPGHGDTDTDSHTGLPLVNKSYAELQQNELIPFEEGVAAGTDMVMTAHIVYPRIESGTYVSKSTGERINLPATLSEKIITGILREDMGFDGVVTTDALNMGAIADNFTAEDAACMAINAGVDLLLMPFSVTGTGSISSMESYIDMLVSAVNNGKIDGDRIDESVGRILSMKAKRGILAGNGLTENEQVKKALATVGCEAHHSAEAETAKKAVTCVKNDKVLPLKRSGNVLVFYPKEAMKNSVNYGADMVKNDNLTVTAICYADRSAGDFAPQISSASSVIVITACTSSRIKSAFAQGIIEEAHSAGKKVTILSVALPYDLAAYPEADALAAAYGEKTMTATPSVFNGETQGYGINIPAAIAVLFSGSYSGSRLPVDIYEVKSDGSFGNEILYPIGSGISF